eukprot:84927-Pyramimonas_sp.AAC.1
MIVAPLGPLGGPLGALLRASVGPLGPFWGHLERLGALLGCLSAGLPENAPDFLEFGAPVLRILEYQSPEYREQRAHEESREKTPLRASRH